MRIISKKRVKCSKTLVYDLTSPRYHNFVLSCGATVHNTANKARDKSYQEILPLRGKIKNAYRNNPTELFESAAVMDILKAIGYDPSKPDPIAHLRVGKIILLGDADDDGKHVNSLNLSLLFRFLPKLFDRGMVYVANGAEYVVEADDRNYYADSPDEMRKIVPNQSLMKRLLHLKGWAEVSAKGLSEMAFNPKTRSLIQLTPTNTKGKKAIEALMGEDVQYRAKWLGV